MDRNSIKFYNAFFGTFLLLQIIFWFPSHKIKPELGIVPPVPGELVIKATSFGDEQLYFRMLGMEIQNAGDSFGRFTALKEYDYPKLYQWFTLLDKLDNKSDYIASIAGYYYSQTQNTPDVIHVVKYLDEHSSRYPEKKWWWLSQAVYLANHKLKDKKLALDLAYKLAATPGIPMWAKQMPAFIHEQLGEKHEALLIIKNILDNHKDLTEYELNFMNYFIKDRLDKIVGE
jgi:hypothetical protein